jgi:hypothetical protein
MRVALPRAVLLILIALVDVKFPLQAQPAPPDGPRATLVIFADHRLREAMWPSLFDAVRREQLVAAAKSPVLGNGVELVRGDSMPPGFTMENPITVYLHGDCTLLPAERLMTVGALGWVIRKDRRIEPFIHVDCTLIAHELGPLALGMSCERRRAAMARAIARVILHEWVHVATQNAKHSSRGLTRMVFTAEDLLAEDTPAGQWKRASAFRGGERSSE